jgi:hypothetical protein
MEAGVAAGRLSFRRNGAVANMGCSGIAIGAATQPVRGSASHEPFELAFRPGQRLLHLFALVEAHRHLGQGCLGVICWATSAAPACRDRSFGGCEDWGSGERAFW